MSKVALIDIDNVIANPSARFAKAEEAKMSYLADRILPTQDDFFGTRVGEHVYEDADVKRATNIYWRTAFTPELAALDALMEGVDLPYHIGGIARIDERKVFYLTSRPESMREATRTWFERNRFPVYDDALIMKPASQQYVKTLVWKSGVVELLVRLLEVDELLYVDDEQAHRDAITALNLPCVCKVAASLQEAVAWVQAQEEGDKDA